LPRNRTLLACFYGAGRSQSSTQVGSGGRNRTDCAFRHQGMSLISARCLSPRRLVPGLKLHGGAAVHPCLRELAEGRRLDRHA